jgi:bacterioferritin-associated ferredoxin
MYVCLCNRLSDTMVSDAVAHGATTPAEVFRRFHMKRGCSGCTVQVASAIDRARIQTKLEAAE